MSCKVDQIRKRNKTGGRQKGTPNRRTLIFEEVLSDLGVSVPKALFDIIPKLALDKQADVYLKLLDFLYPKRRPQEDAPVVIEVESNKSTTDKTNSLKTRVFSSPEALNHAFAYLQCLERDKERSESINNIPT